MPGIDTRDVPQANSLEKVADLLALVNAGIHEDDELQIQLGLVPREIDYYRHAARILGLAVMKPSGLTPTDLGKKLLDVISPAQHKLILFEAVRRARVFSELLKEHNEQQLSREKVAKFLVKWTGLNPTTSNRRADTILAWLEATAL